MSSRTAINDTEDLQNFIQMGLIPSTPQPVSYTHLAGKGPGYERWAKVFNIKQMAAALAYIQDNGLTDYEQLAQKATEAADRFHALSLIHISGTVVDNATDEDGKEFYTIDVYKRQI